MKNQTLRELFIKELQDLYDSENQIIKALPKMIRAAHSIALAATLEQHLEITKEQAVQLEDVFTKFGEQPAGKKCKGMEALLKEADDFLKETDDAEVKDAAIISAAQKVHHYEIAGYTSAHTFAHLLRENAAATVLERLLGEEKEAGARFSALAEEITVEAEQGVSDSPLSRQSGSRSSSASVGAGHSLLASDAEPDANERRDV